MSLHHHRIALSLRLRVPLDALTQHSPVEPQQLGAELASEMRRLCTESRMSYYPALDYFRGNERFDQNLISLLDDMSWLAAQIVRTEIATKLRPVFSNVRIEALQCLCFTLPPVRPGQQDAERRLIDHLTPDTLRVELVVNLLKRNDLSEGLDRYAREVTARWLRESFLDVHVTHAAQVA